MEKKLNREYTLEAYKARLEELEREATNKKNDLVREFALANKPPIKKGDIISDQSGSLKVESFSIRAGWGTTELPYCVFKGEELKKDGTPLKKRKEKSISQNNIIK